jgi:hypothetical protein
MTLAKRATLIVAGLVALLIIGTAVSIRLRSGSEKDPDDSKTPLGGLMGRAMSVSQLKEWMGDLREVHPAVTKFAAAHQDDLPKTVADLRPYLPPKLAALDDDHWELPSSGKMKPLVTGADAATTILLQQKNVPFGKPRIIVYGDGHIEYKK